jgi:hypothetical protein
MTIVRYTVTLYLTSPIGADEDPQEYVTPIAQRGIERMIIQRLRTLDGDTDCEVIDTELVDENDHTQKPLN